jgi:hypothetical protein
MAGDPDEPGGRGRRPEEDAMDDQATEYSLLADDRSLLVRGITLLSVGSVLMLVGGLVTGAVAVRATRRWVDHLEEPPSAVARRTWAQTRSAVAAGARGWQDSRSTTPAGSGS